MAISYVFSTLKRPKTSRVQSVGCVAKHIRPHLNRKVEETAPKLLV